MIESSRLSPSLIKLTTDVTAAFVENNSIAPADLPGLIQQIFRALADTAQAPVSQATAADPPPRAPPVSLKKSITNDYLICLEDGRKFKTLKRHLKSKYDLSPDEYRAKWNLPATYPMAAPAYSAARSALAKANGLGASGRHAKTKTALDKRKSVKR